MTQNTTITAINMVEKVFEFISLTPDSSNWNLPDLKSNPPRLLRLKKIASLFNAYFENERFLELIDGDDYESIIECFFEGKFVLHRDMKDYEEVKQLVFEIVEVNRKYISSNRKFQLFDLEEIFSVLIEYKQKLSALLNFNNRWMEAADISSNFTIVLANTINKNLEGKYDNLDKTLELLINPKGLTFTLEELIANYNYPTEKLDEVDMDFI